MSYDPAKAIELAATEAEKRADYTLSQTAQMIGRAIKRGAEKDCMYCVRVRIAGGPGHDTSPYCRSGRHPHCTCDTCF